MTNLYEQVQQQIENVGGSGNPGDRWVNWQTLCVCGHLERDHGKAIGGTYGGEHGEFGVDSPGCVGATPSRNGPAAEFIRDDIGRRIMVQPPTCPCPKYRPIAMIDRPGRYFRQKVWTKDRVHPMLRGLRAQGTRLSNSKAYGGEGGTWAEELERRLKWLHGKRKCRVCGATGDDVWPSYVNEDRLSQLRCDEHREFPTAEAP